MSDAGSDPYAVLGVAGDVSDDELRRVYRELVKRHHPDHNGGSLQSATRFAQIQSAYAAIAERRQADVAARASASAADPRIDDRIAALERELAAKRAAAPHPQAQRDRPRPTPEQLGYYSTEDSFTKIIDDAAAELLSRARRRD